MANLLLLITFLDITHMLQIPHCVNERKMYFGNTIKASLEVASPLIKDFFIDIIVSISTAKSYQ